MGDLYTGGVLTGFYGMLLVKKKKKLRQWPIKILFLKSTSSQLFCNSFAASKSTTSLIIRFYSKAFKKLKSTLSQPFLELPTGKNY